MFGIDDAALALLVAGGLSTAGSLYANSRNLGLAKDQLKLQQVVNDINWQIAAHNNATQIEMANSAHQREVSDLRAAGLNPILSAGGNGASTPQLTTAQGHTTGVGSPVQSPTEGLASSARGLSSYMGQMYEANLRNRVAGADLTANMSDVAEYEARSAKEQAYQDNIKSMNARQRSNLEDIQLDLETSALDELAYHYSRDGNGVWHKEINKDSEYYKRYKEGLLTNQVIKARQAARNLASDIFSGVNSGSTLINAVNSLRKPFSSWNNIFK